MQYAYFKFLLSLCFLYVYSEYSHGTDPTKNIAYGFSWCSMVFWAIKSKRTVWYNILVLFL